MMRLLLLLFLLLLEKGGEVQSRLLKLRVRSLCHHVTLTNTHIKEIVQLCFTELWQHHLFM